MKPTILAVLLFCLGITSLFAQNNHTIKGSVADTASNIKLINTSIVVLNAKDSILQKFTRTADDGSFVINNLGKGKFILLATYPGYADYVERFTIDSVKTSHDFGRISMILKSKLLQEVIIKSTVAAVKIKGDTTEFNAGAFKIKPNDKVEDLLKQLPGIQVDQNGKITAQGQTVPQVLVDGEEFFGDDPTLVTKNLRADMVDKVQLYDKKSDQATFTGIDDGVKTKTINIKLKQDKKNGYFGKVDALIGTDKYYQEQLMFNRFKGKEKFSLYGNIGNTGTVGLGWEDNSKYGGGGFQVGDDGGFYMNSGGDDLESFDGKYNNQGIPLARTGGVHYDTKWNSDKESINTNYKIGSLNVDGTRNNQSQNTFRDSIYKSVEDQTFHDHMFRQKLDLTYQIKLDTTSNLKIYIDGTDKHSINNTTDTTTTTRQDSLNMNQSLQTTLNRRVNNAVDSKIFNVNAFYTKKFKKVGRTLSVNLAESYNESEATGTLTYQTKYYRMDNSLYRTISADQKKINNNKSSTFNSNITYTEPFTKIISMMVNYGINVDNSTSDRRSYNKPDSTVAGPSPLQDYTILVPSLSNDFKLNQVTNRGGLHLNFKQKKINFNFGTDVANVDFKQIDRVNDNTLNRNFTNWSPNARFQYRFSTQGSFSAGYNGNTTQPNIYQLQPIKDNSNPLYIPIGNPLLKPSFTNSFNFSYYSYKVLSGQFIQLYGNYSATSNPIVDSVTMDNAGNSTSKYINLRGYSTRNGYLSVNLSRKLKFVDMDGGINGSVNGNTFFGYNNNNQPGQAAQLNKTQSYTYSAQATLNKSVDKKYDFGLAAGPTYTVNKSSIQTQVNNSGRGFNGNWWLNVILPAHFGIGTWGNYTFNAKTQAFAEDYRQTNLNAYILRKFLKDQNLKVMIQGLDLLNQNNGFSRSGYGTTLSQSRYTTIKRYFTFTVTWDFNKMGVGAPKQ